MVADLTGQTKPWETEGDHRAFEASGFLCRVERNPELLTLNGYIHLPETHPLFGAETMDGKLDCIPVHGGWTYACPDEEERVEPSTWVIGFDCCHLGDFSPGMHQIRKERPYPVTFSMLSNPANYRDMDYVERELRNAAEALAMMGRFQN